MAVFADSHLSLDVWRSGASLCFRYDALGSFGHGCTPVSARRRLQVMWARVGPSGSLLFGVTSLRTARLAVQLPGGRRVTGRVGAAPASVALPLKFFATYVPPNPSIKGVAARLAAIAFDSHGRVVARVSV